VSDFWLLVSGVAAICMSCVYAAGVGYPPYRYAENLCGFHAVVFLVGGIALVLQAFWRQIRVLL
jgi:hypothetical protein